MHVVVIGGGITGLSAAWYLQKLENVTYTLVEKSGAWGGKIKTEKVDLLDGSSFVVEAGPDSFISQKPWATQLAEELGIGDALLGTNDESRQVFVLSKGKPTPLPDGVMMIVPTRFMPFVVSPLISIPGKLRMALEPFLPPKQSDEDESLSDFVRRRLGAEALDKLAEPLMSGIYNTDAEKQSLLATFPRFRSLETQYGSLTRGMLAARQQHKSQAAVKSGKPTSMFTSFYQGMQQLVDHLVSRLEGDLRLNTGVSEIFRGQSGGYALRLEDGEVLGADAVIISAPSYTAANMLAESFLDATALLRKIRYVDTGTVSLAYRVSDLPKPPDNFGMVIPRSEARAINAITWSSVKFNHRAPDDYVLLRVFFGGSRTPESMNLSDSDLLSVVKSELLDLMQISADPVFTRIYRWKNANPQYDVGHLSLMDRIESNLPETILLAGSAYRGIGVPDCVHQGKQAVEKISVFKQQKQIAAIQSTV